MGWQIDTIWVMTEFRFHSNSVFWLQHTHIHTKNVCTANLHLPSLLLCACRAENDGGWIRMATSYGQSINVSPTKCITRYTVICILPVLLIFNRLHMMCCLFDPNVSCWRARAIAFNSARGQSNLARLSALLVVDPKMLATPRYEIC